MEIMKNPIESLSEYIFGKTIASVRNKAGAQIRIVKRGPYRELLFNGTVFSRITEGKLLTGSYWDYFLPLPALAKHPTILVIGLGGGTIPYQIESTYADASVEVAELDESIASLCRKFLGRDLKSKVVIADGIDYMRSFSSKYDLIIADAYIDYNMPDEFFSDEFVDSAYKALKVRGILAMNYTLTSYGIAQSKQFVEKLKAKFETYMLASPLSSGNRIVVCTKGYTKDEIAGSAASMLLAEEHTYITKAYREMQQL